MSEWQPIKGAPLNRPIEVGGWCRVGLDGKLIWFSDIDVIRRGLFLRILSRWDKIIPPTVWRELPPPPTTEDAQ